MHAFMMGLWSWVMPTPLVGLGMGAVVAFLFWKQPQQTMRLLIAALVLVALGYLVSAIIDFAMDSAMVKERAMDKSQ